jgi:uncharacterized protein with ParB-like and HNH nuclease domain
MEATEKKFIEFLKEQQEKKLLIPIYQRAYEWTTKKDKEVQTLWEDIENIEDENSTHFINSIVYIADEQNSVYINIIDGQQRITTLSILYIVIRDRLVKLQKEKKFKMFLEDIKIVQEQIEENYLIRKWQKGDDKVRLSLSNKNKDREIYNKLVLGEYKNLSISKDKNSNLIKTYKFFNSSQKISSYSFEEIQTLLSKIERVVIVKVTLELEKDNPQIVFSSIHGGLKLKDTDLIKNSIFMKLERVEQEKLHSELWETLEYDMSEKEFAIFISYFLTLKLNRVVSSNAIYDEFVNKYFKNFLAENEFEKVQNVLLEISSYKDIFLQLKNGSIFEELSILPYFNIEAYFPFLMKIRKEESPFFTKIWKIIESFYVRRFVYGLPPGATKNIFALLCKYENIEVSQFINFLEEKSKQQRFPKRDEFEESLRNRNLYEDNKTSTKAILFALEKSLDSEFALSRENFEEFSVEHVLPQEYEKLDSCWKDNFSEEEHKKELHLMKNLTILRKEENSSAGIGCFKSKKHIYNSSELALNEKIADYDSWTKKSMEDYLDKVVELALKRWEDLENV